MVHLFLGASDGHTAFTTLLHLDASFMMAPRALHLRNSTASGVPPILRLELGKLPARWS